MSETGRGSRPLLPAFDMGRWSSSAAGMLVVGGSIGLLAAIGVVLAGPFFVVGLAGGVLAMLCVAYRPGILFAAYLLIPYYKAVLQPFSPVDLTVLLAGLNALQILPVVTERRPRDMSRTGLLMLGAMGVLVVGGVLYAPLQDLALGHAAAYWILVLLAIVPAAIRVGSDDRHVRDFLWAFFAMGVVTVLFGLLDLPSGDRVTALGMNTIQTARAALLVPLLGVTFVLRERVPIMRPILVVLIPAAIVVALATGSRGPVLVLVLMALLGLARGAVHPRAVNWRSVGIIAGLGVASIVVLSVVAPSLPAASIGRFGEFADFIEGASSGAVGGSFGDTSSQARVLLFELAFSLFGRQPLLGVGTGGFEVFSARYLGPAGLPYPHNALLQIAAELGIIGLTVFVGLVVVAFSRRIPAASPLGAVRVLLLFFLLNAMVSGDIFTDRETWGLLTLVLVAEVSRAAEAVRPSVSSAAPDAPRRALAGAFLAGRAGPPGSAAPAGADQLPALEMGAGRPGA